MTQGLDEDNIFHLVSDLRKAYYIAELQFLISY